MPYNDELTHYGILGMKWGVRRYQNKDGTLTEAGKQRLAKKSLKRDGGEYQKQETEFNKEMVIGKGDYKKAIERMEVFTNDELDIIIQRHGKEVAMRDFTVKELQAETAAKKAKKDARVAAFDRASKIVKSASEMAANGTALYNSIAKAANVLTDANLPIIGEKKERGVNSKSSVRYEEVPENDRFMKKIETVITENANGTVSRKDNVEWVSKKSLFDVKQNEGKGEGKQNKQQNQNQPKQDKQEKKQEPSKVNNDGSWKDHEYVDRKKVDGEWQYKYKEDEKKSNGSAHGIQAQPWGVRKKKSGGKHIKTNPSFWERYANASPYGYGSWY